MKIYVVVGVMLFMLIIGAIGGYYFCKSGIAAKLTNQQSIDKTECEKDQQITQEANDALKKNNDAISAKLAASGLQQPACVHPTGSADLPSGGTKRPRPNGHGAQPSPGISTRWLRSYAAQCETYRGEVAVCINFLAQERKALQPDPDQ